MKKVISVLLVLAILCVFTSCGLTKTVQVECTCPGCLAAKKALEKSNSGSDVEYSKLEAESKSGVDCSKMPSSDDTQGILDLYNGVANATKQAKDQTLEVIADGARIHVGSIKMDKSGDTLSSSMMTAANKIIDQFSPKPADTKYHFVNGVDKNGNKDDEGKIKTSLNTLPVSKNEKMSVLDISNVKEASCEELKDGYWKVRIVIKDSELELKSPKVTPHTPHADCMDTLLSQYLLTSFGNNGSIYYADLYYKDSEIVAIIDPASGYLVQLFTGLYIYGNVQADVKLLKIGGVHATLEKTTYNTTYNWTEIG